MTRLLHFTLGPVQGFVAQARRTRDLWAGSFLLSYLSGHAMKAVLEASGDTQIAFPDVGSRAEPRDPLLAAILGRPLAKNPIPRIGSLPNRFKAEVPASFDADLCRQAVQSAWREIADQVWQRYISPVAARGNGSQEIWRRQVEGFWDMSWVMGETPINAEDRSDNAWLDQRKNWRSYLPPPEPGDKCTLMSNWQELSGYVRATERAKQEAFWDEVRKRVGKLNLAENERLSSVALIKRLFPNVAKQTIGWELDAQSWPSTSYMAAVPWLRDIETAEDVMQPREAQRLAAEYPAVVQRHVTKEIFGEHSSDLSCLQSNPFNQLDGQLYFPHAIENDEERSLSPEGKGELQGHLRALNAAVGRQPSPFYALLLMDGDSLGKLLQTTPNSEAISRALAHFTEGAAPIIRAHCGKTVYAGGDDVLAFLPLDTALEAVTALRQSYILAFRRELSSQHPRATISAGLVFAHFRTSLRAAMREAQYLLDEVAKDGNGRDSLAVSVLTSSGRTVEWVSSWEEETTPRLVPDIVRDLADGFDEQFASKFFYNVRARFGLLTGDAGPEHGYELIDGLDAAQLLVAEYKKSREREVATEEAEERVGQLMRVCRVRMHGRENPNTLNVQGAMLVRFLATKGRGVEQ